MDLYIVRAFIVAPPPFVRCAFPLQTAQRSAHQAHASVDVHHIVGRLSFPILVSLIMSSGVPQHRNAQPSKEAVQQSALAAPPQQQAPQPTIEWNEDDYVLALAHLEQLQGLVSSLRTTIPQLVRSLTRKHESPQALHHAFSKAAVGGSRKLADLRKVWEGSHMRDVRLKAASSVQEHGRSIDDLPEQCWEGVKEAIQEMPRYGWIEEAEVLRGRKRKREQEEGPDGATDGAQQEERIIEEFRKRHAEVTAEMNGEPRQITVDFKTTDDELLHFDISPQTSDGKTIFNVTGPRIPDTATKGERKLLQAVHRCLGKRPKVGHLDHTLETIAAYRDLGEARCDVCHRLVDSEMLLPASRRSKRVKTEAGEELKWIATHESCIKDVT